MLSRLPTFARLACCKLRASTLAPLSQISTRQFSVADELEKSKRRVNKIMMSELRHEKENEERDESIDQFLHEKGWTLFEEDQHHVVRIQKNLGSNIVDVWFIARSPAVEPDEVPEGYREQDNQGGVNPDEFTDFTVAVSGQDSKTLVFEVSTSGGYIECVAAKVVDDFLAYKKLNLFNNTTNTYKGPQMESLDEKLGQTLEDYLRSFGVDEEVGTFVEHYAVSREQSLYVGWLNKTKEWF